ncbi:MAG: hypothetical protein ACTSPP_04035 [Candidatus Heimdallarchaeaceae archaeon]
MNSMNKQKIVRWLIWIIAIVIIFTIGLAWFFYPEPYDFFNEAISNLGGINSETGIPNGTSSLIMIIGFSLISVISFSIFIDYLVTKELTYRIRKAIWSLAISIGAVGIAIPYDHSSFYFLHYIGAFTFVISFGGLDFDCQALRFFRMKKEDKHKGKMHVSFDVVFVFIVFAVVILHVLAFIFDRVGIAIPDYSIPLTQKIVLIVNIIAVFLLDVEDM